MQMMQFYTTVKASELLLLVFTQMNLKSRRFGMGWRRTSQRNVFSMTPFLQSLKADKVKENFVSQTVNKV